MASEPTISEMARAVARELEDEGRWCSGALARDRRGAEVLCRSKHARSWCAVGHAIKVSNDSRAADRLADAYEKRFGVYIGTDNDDKGREFVRARLLELADAHEAEARGEGRDG